MSLILRDPLDSFIYNMLTDFPVVRYPSKRRFWTPAMDVVEKENGLEASIEVAGMKPNDIKIELKDNNVVISGCREEERKEENSQYHRYERRSGSFERSFSVYPGTKNEDISANVSNGVLTVLVKKTERSSQPYLIPITQN